MKRLIIFTTLCLLLIGCGNNEEAIQNALGTAFAGTETARPTLTKTLEPTNIITSSPEPSFTPTQAFTETPESTNTPEPTNTPRNTNTPKPSPTPLESEMHSLKLGEEYHAFGYFMKIEEFVDPLIAHRADDVPSGYKVVSILIVIGNIDGEPNDIWTFDFNLVDRDGFLYENEHSVRSDRLDFEKQDNLLPGEKGRGWLSFFIPENSTPSYIKYNIDDDMWLYAGLATEE